MENNNTLKNFREVKKLTPEELEKITGAGSPYYSWYCTACNASGPIENIAPDCCPNCGSDSVMICFGE